MRMFYCSLEAVCEGGILFNIYREVQEVFLSRSHRLARQTSRLVHQRPLEYLVYPRLFGGGLCLGFALGYT